MAEEILEFVREIVEIGIEVSPDTPLYSSGIIDSMKHIQFINFLEKTYQIVIPISSINLNNFDTVEAIYTFVNKLKNE